MSSINEWTFACSFFADLRDKLNLRFPILSRQLHLNVTSLLFGVEGTVKSSKKVSHSVSTFFGWNITATLPPEILHWKNKHRWAIFEQVENIKLRVSLFKVCFFCWEEVSVSKNKHQTVYEPLHKVFTKLLSVPMLRYVLFCLTYASLALTKKFLHR